MRISLSQIAWEKEENQEIYSLLKKYNIPGIDIAPTKIWDTPLHVTDQEIEDVRKKIKDAGFATPGMQSIHYGHPDLELFSTEKSRAELQEHTIKMASLAHKLGVKTIVFGSPKNRMRKKMELAQATEIAATFFREIGASIAELDVTIAIEPNAAAYECDFITTGEEGLSFVKQVNHKNIRLHLDTGSMILMKEEIPAIIEKAGDTIAHFHVSSPYLEQVGNEEYRKLHEEAYEALQKIGYTGWISIEMKSGISHSNTESIEQALLFTTSIYDKKNN